MTYIEFFDKPDAENIGACLTKTPKRVIYIGDNSKKMKRHVERYKKVFIDRGADIEFIYKTVNKNNLDNAVELLEEIVKTYDNCVFDITGGEGILTVALGIVYTKYPEKNIEINSINIKNNTVCDCDKDGKTIYENYPELSVEENVRIYGGEVVFGGIGDKKTYKWKLDNEFFDDINIMWGICRQNPRYWNVQIGILATIENEAVHTSDGTAVAKIADVERSLQHHKLRYRISKKMIEFLRKKGLITLFNDSDGQEVKIKYKNNQVKKCLTTAGLALEMKVYISAKSALDENGKPVYNDVINGAFIDWDGKYHDEENEDIYDTENEIDVFMMKGIIPVFVSCKNGNVSTEELYKLNTVADRFGGKYAKKVLVATSINELGEAGKYLRQRMEDMNIRLIDNIQHLSDNEIERKIKSFWNN